MGVPLTTVKELRVADHDAFHLRDEGLIRLPDPMITSKAVAESRIMLTFVLDFGDLLATSGSEGPSLIIFQLRNQTPAIATNDHSPPATMINSPLIHRESSEARNTTGKATSSGSPMRPKGVRST